MSTDFYTIKNLSEMIGLSTSTIRLYSSRAGVSKYFIAGKLLPINLIPFLNEVMPIIGYKISKIKAEDIKMAYARRLFTDAREQYLKGVKETKNTRWTKPEIELLTYGDDLTVIQGRLLAIGKKRTLYAIAKKRSLL